MKLNFNKIIISGNNLLPFYFGDRSLSHQIALNVITIPSLLF